MKTLIAVSVVAVMAMTSGAQAGGFCHKRVSNNVLSNITGIAVGLTTRDINVLNGVLTGNGILGLGGHNRKHW